MRADSFDVLNAMSGIASMIARGGFFVRIQRQPHRAVSDGMGEYLDALLIELRHCLFVMVRSPTQAADLRWVVSVGSE